MIFTRYGIKAMMKVVCTCKYYFFASILSELSIIEEIEKMLVKSFANDRDALICAQSKNKAEDKFQIQT
jgi:hypothetical protein